MSRSARPLAGHGFIVIAPKNIPICKFTQAGPEAGLV